MKRYIVLSVNDNPDYLYFTPLTCWAWRHFGWEPILFMNGDVGPFADSVPWTDHVYRVNVNGYRSDTITQVSRLYAGSLGIDGMLMTGDIDMIPLSDYWHPQPEHITIYGHDLTGFTHYPICYIAMTTQRWIEVMCSSNMKYEKDILRDLNQFPQAKDPDFYKYWFTDQDIITQRIDETEFEKRIVERGKYKNGFAVGRVDRGAWTLDHARFIDAHLFHQVYHRGREKYFHQTLELLFKIWPNHQWDWFIDYTNKFKKITGHG